MKPRIQKTIDVATAKELLDLKIWERLAEYHADTKEVYEARYKAGLG